MAISAAAVKNLRDRTGAPMMACKAALEKATGDMEKAIQFIRETFASVQVAKGERETAEGRIASYIDPAQKIGALVEMRCESAPVAKSDPFVQLANDIARHVAHRGTSTVEALLTQPYVDDPKKTVNDRIVEVVGLIRENMKPARMARLTGLLGSYIHHNGSVGVLLQVEGSQAEPQLLTDICMHITAQNPVACRRQDVPSAVLEKEKEIAQAQIAADPRNKNKPANIVEKIAESKMKTWFAENILVEQPFVKDDSKTVGQLLESAGLKVVQFVRFKVGELS